MKGPSLLKMVSALKNTIKENKFDVDILADADDQRFLDKQKEDRVNYSELDAKGKAIYNKNRQKAGLAPLKSDVFKTKKGGPVETDKSKEGNVSAYIKKNQQYVDKDKTIPLDPGYEDTKKIQKVQLEGLIPSSQNFDKKIKKLKKPDQAKFSDLEKSDDDRE